MLHVAKFCIETKNPNLERYSLMLRDVYVGFSWTFVQVLPILGLILRYKPLIPPSLYSQTAMLPIHYPKYFHRTLIQQSEVSNILSKTTGFSSERRSSVDSVYSFDRSGDSEYSFDELTLPNSFLKDTDCQLTPPNPFIQQGEPTPTTAIVQTRTAIERPTDAHNGFQEGNKNHHWDRRQSPYYNDSTDQQHQDSNLHLQHHLQNSINTNTTTYCIHHNSNLLVFHNAPPLD